MLRVIFFDRDETLVDQETAFEQAYQSTPIEANSSSCSFSRAPGDIIIGSPVVMDI